jgi:uncharacterized protein (DUF2147 family)
MSAQIQFAILLRQELIMKPSVRFSVLAASIGLILAGPALAADLSPYGVWLRKESQTLFDFYNCANKLCAKVVGVGKGDDKKTIGTNILRNAVNKDGEWKGELFNAENGKTYKGSVKIDSPTKLSLEGCLVGFLCKTETWVRAPDQSLASTPNGTPAMPAPASPAAVGH